jgi:hypothetical protein
MRISLCGDMTYWRMIGQDRYVMGGAEPAVAAYGTDSAARGDYLAAKRICGKGSY